MHFDGFVFKKKERKKEKRSIYMPYLIKNLPVTNIALGRFNIISS